MNKLQKVTVLIILISTTSFAQTYIRVNQVAIQKNNTYINNNAGLYSVSYAISSFRNAMADEKKKAREIEKAKSQLTIVKNVFNETSTFPERITDGWHVVKVTDNFNYCSDAKVLVTNNEIKELVIDNYAALSIPFNTISGIKNAKSTISINATDGNSDTAEIYFLYDLDKPNITSPPLQAGFVTFWSDLSNAKTIEVWIEKQIQGGLEEKLDEADCFAHGALTLRLKPGIYDFRAESRGSRSWRGTIEIKENECYTYPLINKNKD